MRLVLFKTKEYNNYLLANWTIGSIKNQLVIFNKNTGFASSVSCAFALCLAPKLLRPFAPQSTLCLLKLSYVVLLNSDQPLISALIRGRIVIY